MKVGVDVPALEKVKDELFGLVELDPRGGHIDQPDIYAALVDISNVEENKACFDAHVASNGFTSVEEACSHKKEYFSCYYARKYQRTANHE